MIADLKPYPELRGSGVDWLGPIPAAWECVRARRLFREIDRRSESGSETHLSMSQELGLVPSSQVEHRTLISESYAGGKLCEQGDLVLNRLKAHLGVFACAKQSGVISPDYTVLRQRSPMVERYFEQILKSPACRGELRVRAKGIVEGFWRLYTDDFYEIRLPRPPLAEQALIVRFLNHADRKIRRAIAAKQKLIKLLEEQKHAIVHRAVTRGLDPNVRLKPSGIEWLGDVPEHWTVARNMALFRNRVEAGRVGLPVLQVSLRSGVTAEGLDQFGRPKRLIADPSKYKRIYRGDLAYNTMRMWQGAVGVSPEDGVVSPAYVVLEPRGSASSGFYELVFRTPFYKEQANRQSTGIVSDRNRLYWGSFKQMPNVVPPRVEQDEIAEFVCVATQTLESAIGRSRSEIGFLREYRTRLIADVVTGKLDVREAAAKLPDDIESSDPIEPEALEDEDGGDDEAMAEESGE